MKRESYKEAKQAAKKAVTEAKNRGYEDMYRKLDTKEGEKQIFKLARTRAKQRQDLEAVKYIKDGGVSSPKTRGDQNQIVPVFLTATQRV